MSPCHCARRCTRVVFSAAALCLLWLVAALPARADGLLEAITANEEAFYYQLAVKTTEKLTGTTTKTDIVEYGSRTTLGLNYNLLPTLNLNSGATYEKNFTDLSGDTSDTHTALTRLRPYLWLNFRDPIIGASVGYDLLDEKVKTSGLQETSLTRETYNGNVNWRPVDLPFTTARYTRTSIWDGTRELLDTTQDQVYLKTEYLYRGLDVYYAGTYLDTRDKVRDSQARQTMHEGRLLYATTFLDKRISVSTDNRIRSTELLLDNGVTFTGLGTTIGLSVPAVAGLSSIDTTPITDPLASNPALIDGDQTTSAGINIGFTGEPPTNLRNVGLDFGAAVTVNRLQVSVDGFGPGVLPADISTFYIWQVWTSANNLNWTLQTTVAPAVFSPLDRRFVINFSPLTSRYIKITVQPLPGTVIGTTNTSLFPTIFITEMQAFNDSTTGGTQTGTHRRFTQLVRSHNIDLSVILLRTAADLLYYRFNGEYQEFDAEETTTRYVISNGLFLSHRFNDIFSGSANASYEIGKERNATRNAVLYYASLSATPLRTLTDSLVFSGNREWLSPTDSTTTTAGTSTTTAETMSTTDSLVLYNTAQLYRGIDLTLNLGALLTSEEQRGGPSTQRRETYVNIGTAISPHPALTMTTYYLGKLTHTSGDTGTTGSGGSADSTQHTLDLGLSFSPFRTLTMSAQANIVSETDRPTTVNQNYSVNWAPFPDGTLQLSIAYAESHFSDNASSRIFQPSVRWYMSSRRRSYLEVGYQLNTSDSVSVKTEAQGFNARLNVFY